MAIKTLKITATLIARVNEHGRKTGRNAYGIGSRYAAWRKAVPQGQIGVQLALVVAETGVSKASLERMANLEVLPVSLFNAIVAPDSGRGLLALSSAYTLTGRSWADTVKVAVVEAVQAHGAALDGKVAGRFIDAVTASLTATESDGEPVPARLLELLKAAIDGPVKVEEPDTATTADVGNGGSGEGVESVRETTETESKLLRQLTAKDAETASLRRALHVALSALPEDVSLTDVGDLDAFVQKYGQEAS